MRKTDIARGSGVVVVMFVLSACAGTDSKTANASVPQPTTYEGKPGQLICHPIVHEGALTGKQECHTQAGWDRLRREFTLRTMNDVQRHSLTGGSMP